MNQTERLEISPENVTFSETTYDGSTATVQLLFTLMVNDSNSTETENSTATVAWPVNCYQFVANYGVIACVICALAFLLGVLFCFFGYRLFRASLIAMGFVFGSEIVFFVCVEEDVFPLGGKLGLSVGAGLLCGLAAVLIHYIGYFVAGFQFGLLVSVAGLIILEQFYHPFTKWIPFGVLLGTAIIAALIALRWQKDLMILSTSVVGAALVLVSIDYFVDSSRAASYVYDRLSARLSLYELCWYSWMIIAIWPLLATFGAILQYCVTGAKFDHRQQPQVISGIKPSRHRHKRGEDIADTPENHYRHLYQIRRVKGDVISKSYMQSVQNQVPGAASAVRLLDQTATDTPVVGATTDDSFVTMTAIADIEA